MLMMTAYTLLLSESKVVQKGRYFIVNIDQSYTRTRTHTHAHTHTHTHTHTLHIALTINFLSPFAVSSAVETCTDSWLSSEPDTTTHTLRT